MSSVSAAVLQPAVGQAQGLPADAFETEVDMFGAESPRPGERGVGERPQRQGREFRIDLSHCGNLSRPTKTGRSPLASPYSCYQRVAE